MPQARDNEARRRKDMPQEVEMSQFSESYSGGERQGRNMTFGRAIDSE